MDVCRVSVSFKSLCGARKSFQQWSTGNLRGRQNFVLIRWGCGRQNQFKFSSVCVISVRAPSPISHPNLFYIQHVICHLQHTNTGDQSLVLLFFFSPLSIYKSKNVFISPCGFPERGQFKTRALTTVNCLGVEAPRHFPFSNAVDIRFVFFFFPLMKWLDHTWALITDVASTGATPVLRDKAPTRSQWTEIRLPEAHKPPSAPPHPSLPSSPPSNHFCHPKWNSPGWIIHHHFGLNVKLWATPKPGAQRNNRGSAQTQRGSDLSFDGATAGWKLQIKTLRAWIEM